MNHVNFIKSLDSHSESPEKNKINEPVVSYSGSKKITTPNSFEAAEDFKIWYWAGLTPEQRFADFYELMSRFYSFGKPDWSRKKIIIDL
ncbi:MAG TPA: hypothetical protein PLM56_18360 [Cyclobacteriaceae bacterium]|jgi:hypothetical protein|nr:hypothetical protein [Cyclobacteriaceae bacterium]HRF35474.1 hypothetical protein [Cyclobacteriaceae bacterium]